MITRVYKEEQLLCLGKRVNNIRRRYLLINPLQAKHMPVSPSEAYEMMRALGEKVFAGCRGEKAVVLGFAETATAIGAVVAACFSDECHYQHTTREYLGEGVKVYSFLEEHSHAVDQNVCSTGLLETLKEAKVAVLVDDEISTGKTVLNMIHTLQENVPQMDHLTFVVASVLNRMGEDERRRFTEEGIQLEYLCSLAEADYDLRVEAIDARAPEIFEDSRCGKVPQGLAGEVNVPGKLDPRLGVAVRYYNRACKSLSEWMVTTYGERLRGLSKLLLVGTEEFMYPVIAAGMLLEQRFDGLQVYCQATTRSPIGVSSQERYPIFAGYQIPSFYEEGRRTFIYNPASYDMVLIVTDSKADIREAYASLAELFFAYSCREIHCVRWVV